MYLNTTIKIPEIKGKIITKKKGTTTYILYQYGSEYRPEKTILRTAKNYRRKDILF